MNKKTTTDELYAQYVAIKSGSSKLYADVLDEILNSPRLKKINTAKNADDFATVEIGTNRLGTYIVQLVNDVISYIGSKQGREESEDVIREDIGLSNLTRYKGEFLKIIEIAKKVGRLEEE